MKHILVILVACLYLLGLTEISVSFHHCGKKLKYVTINNGKDKVCCGKKGKKSHCCCTDKEVKYNIDDQSIAKKLAVSAKFVEKVLNNSFSYIQPGQVLQRLLRVFPIPHPPPLLFGNLRNHLVNCVFLI